MADSEEENPFIEKDDSNKASKYKGKRTKGVETIEEEIELVSDNADQTEEDLELDSKKKEEVHDNNEECLQFASWVSEEVYDNNEDTQFASWTSNDYTWIKENIKMRKCKTFIPSEDNNKICKCGYREDEHASTDPTNKSTESEWKCLENTDILATNAFGEINFVSNRGNIAKFVRVDRETKMSTMRQLMTEVWGMETPNMLISVTGSTGTCEIEPELKYTFQRNLMKAASSTGAWIITGATHTGVTKCIGDAVKDYRLTSAKQRDIVVIGIVPWGVIQNKRLLQNIKGLRVVLNSVGKKNVSNQSFLDPNHSHFIMVDDGTQHKYGTEITFRANLEHEISKMKPSDSNADRIGLGSVLSSVPRVILVLNGGPSALETVQIALKQRTPVVIIKGSGGAADILAGAIRLETTNEDESSKIRLISDYMKMTEFCSDKDIDVNIQRIKDCLDNDNLLHISERDSGSGAFELDTAMLEALWRGNSSQFVQSLALAIVWDKYDSAKIQILTEMTEMRRSRLRSLETMMLLAIQMNRANFVELFLDLKLGFSQHLAIEKLELYANGRSKYVLSMLLSRMWREENEGHCNTRITLKEIGRLVKHLLSDYHTLHQYEHKYQEEHPDAPLGNLIAELFLWSVLNNLQEMAIFFWLRTKEHIATALVTSALFNAISRRVHDKELIAKLKQNASYFSELAIEVVNEAYRLDERNVELLLTRTVTMWANTSCIIIAVETKNQSFVFQTEFVELFQSIWRGQLKQENSIWMLLICSAFPPLIPLFVTFKENGDRENSNSVQKPKKKGLSTGDEANENDPCKGKQDAKAAKSQIIANICCFYKAPVVIFCHNVISYVIFLCLYSYILLCQLRENWTVQEFILIGWVFTILTEEIRQISAMPMKKSYIRDAWNKIDILTIFLFAIGMTFRCFAMPEIIEASRVILGVDLIIFFIRFLQFFCLYKEFGSKLAMIIQTLQSMIYFVVILMVFVVAYAIASQAILYPNAELNQDNVIAIFLRPYWNIYGELMLERFEGADDCPDDQELYRNGTYSHCPSKSGKYFGPLLMAVYMMICNTLLLNLLIIMFSNTYKKIQTNIDMYWSPQLLRFFNEYKSQPILPPPIIIIEHAYQLIHFLVLRNRSCCQSTASSTKNDPNHDLHKLQDDAAQMIHRKRIHQYDEESKALQLEEENEHRFVRIMDKIDKLEQQLKELLQKKGRITSKGIITSKERITSKEKNTSKETNTSKRRFTPRGSIGRSFTLFLGPKLVTDHGTRGKDTREITGV